MSSPYGLSSTQCCKEHTKCIFACTAKRISKLRFQECLFFVFSLAEDKWLDQNSESLERPRGTLCVLASEMKYSTEKLMPVCARLLICTLLLFAGLMFSIYELYIMLCECLNSSIWGHKIAQLLFFFLFFLSLPFWKSFLQCACTIPILHFVR